MSRNTVKCMLVGDSAVGKTCLLTSYTYKEFPTGYIPPAFGGHAETVMVGDVPYTLGVFDTIGPPLGSGTTEYDRRRNPQIIRERQGEIVSGGAAPLSRRAVYCRCDADRSAGQQQDGRECDHDAQGEKLARELKAAAYVECSAKTREGVQRTFDAAVAAAVKDQQGPFVERKKKKCIIV